VAAMTEERRYSCDTAADTLAWINDIIHFLTPYFSSFINPHVVNFFKVPSSISLDQILLYFFFLNYYNLINFFYDLYFQDKLWENVNAEWIDCLRNEPVQNLLLIPSGVVQVLVSSFIFFEFFFL
jgi:hypothetical protein